MIDKDLVTHFSVLGGFGALIGIGQVLSSNRKISWKYLIGKAICSAGLGSSAVLIGLIHESASFEIQVGVACALSTVGSDVIVRMLMSKITTPVVTIEPQDHERE